MVISGSLVALVTPMHENDSIDWGKLDELVDWHLESGTNGIVPVGTTGESPTVDVTEHCDIIERVVKRVAGKVAVVAGTGANNTKEAVYLTHSALEAGADACLSVTPYYNKPSQEGLFQHYKTIAETVALPMLLYNVPGRTCCDLLPETVARLAAIDNIIGIKEATGDISRTLEILSLCPEGMDVFSGDDATAVDLMLNGAKGTISVTANLVPKTVAEVCAAALSGDSQKAHALNEPIEDLHHALFLEANPIPIKFALAEVKKIEPALRLPLTPLSSKYHEQLRAAMRKAKVL